MKCPNCDGKGELPDPEPKTPPTKLESAVSCFFTLLVMGFILWCIGGFMRDCGRSLPLAPGMCGLIGIEALVPLSLLWLFRKIR